MNDYQEEERKRFIKAVSDAELRKIINGEPVWWWAIGLALLAVLIMLVLSVGPVVFPVS